VESSGDQGFFLFFSGSRTIFGAGSETIFVLYFSLLTVLRIRDVYDPVSNKILNYLSSEVIKKILVNFQRIIELFVYGPGIRNKPIPDPGSRGQKGTLSRIRIRIKSIRIRIRGEPPPCLSVSNQCCGFGMFIPDLGS